MTEGAKTAERRHPAAPLHLPLTRVSLDGVLALIESAPDSEEAKRCRRRLGWFMVASIARAVGFFAGWACFLSTVLAIPVVAVIVSLGHEQSRGSRSVIDVVFGIVLWSFIAWIYLNVLVGTLAPSTRFAQKLRHLEQQGKPRGNRMTRTDTVLVLQASGGLARTFFRILTRRFFSSGVRPDLAADVAVMAQTIMLAVPRGLDAGNKDDFASYAEFLKDVLGLLIVQRLDKLEKAVRSVRPGLLVAADSGGDEGQEELRTYLQPLIGRASVDVLVGVIFPIGAFLISVGALLASLLK